MRTAHKRAAEGETGDPAPSSDEEQQQHFSGKRIAVAAEVFDAVAQLDDGLRDKSKRSYVTQLKHYVKVSALKQLHAALQKEYKKACNRAKITEMPDLLRITVYNSAYKTLMKLVSGGDKISLGARNPSHGVLNSCNVFASIAGAHKKHAMQQSMAAWGQLPKATKDLYKQAAKHINDDGLEVLDSALDAHWERRVVQTSFFEEGTPGQCRPRSEYACISADEGFEQFLTPAELREWRQYKDSLDERLAELAGRSLQCRKAAVDDDQILALEEELDPLQVVLASMCKAAAKKAQQAAVPGGVPGVEVETSPTASQTEQLLMLLPVLLHQQHANSMPTPIAPSPNRDGVGKQASSSRGDGTGDGGNSGGGGGGIDSSSGSGSGSGNSSGSSSGIGNSSSDSSSSGSSSGLWMGPWQDPSPSRWETELPRTTAGSVASGSRRASESHSARPGRNVNIFVVQSPGGEQAVSPRQRNAPRGRSTTTAGSKDSAADETPGNNQPVPAKAAASNEPVDWQERDKSASQDWRSEQHLSDMRSSGTARTSVRFGEDVGIPLLMSRPEPGPNPPINSALTALPRSTSSRFLPEPSRFASPSFKLRNSESGRDMDAQPAPGAAPGAAARSVVACVEQQTAAARDAFLRLVAGGPQRRTQSQTQIGAAPPTGAAPNTAAASNDGGRSPQPAGRSGDRFAAIVIARRRLTMDGTSPGAAAGLGAGSGPSAGRPAGSLPQLPAASVGAEGQATTQPASSEPGPSTPQPAKRSKRTKAEQAAELTQLTKDCTAALNMQRIGESRWRTLELCYWPEQGALPAKGMEYPGLGYKRLRDEPPMAQQQQQPAVAQ
ncbi:hypothetical protein QJQ45_001459 [Haematococcus lacustris]|nr:hypothetical protein QJQ45_001459 [Haematococcus lacustris]